MASPLRILMTACGAPGAPGILKCLRNNREREVFVYGVDMNADAVGFAMVDAGRVCRPGQSEGYAQEILDIAVKEHIRVVLPLSTMELIPLAQAAGRFHENGIAVLVSDLDGLRIANNKGALMEAATSCGVAVPRFIRVNNVDEFQRAALELGYPARPVCFKPEFGKGGRGFRILSQGQDRFSDLFDKKPQASHLSLEEALAILRQRGSIPPLLVMEYLPGDEYSVDILCKDGRCLVAIPRLREVIRLGICFIGRTENHQGLIDSSRRLVERLRLSYCINFQFKLGGAGDWKLLEANPRVSGTIVLCAGAGVNLPYLAVKLGLNEPVGTISPIWGTRMIRYWDEVFYDAGGRPFALPDGWAN